MLGFARSSPRSLLVLALLASLGACADSHDPVTPAATPRLDQSQGDSVIERVVKVKKDHKLKKYRVRINKHDRTMTLTTLSECNPYNLLCDNFVEDGVDGDSYFGDVTDESWPFTCPEVVPANPIAQTYFYWKGHLFFISQSLWKQSSLLPYLGVIPRGRYALPNGPWESTDGEATIWNGTLDGTCYTRPFGLGYRGVVVWNNFRGNAEEWTGNGTSSDGSPEYGGGEEEGGGGSGDWEEALQQFVLYGQCSEGWVIIVDGARVC